MERAERPMAKSIKTRIPIGRPDITELERANVARAMSSGWITQGPFVEEAQEKLKTLTRRKYALCVSSGTTALIVALLARPGDRWYPDMVAVPAMTFAAVHNAVKVIGGKPIYCPANLESWQVHSSDWSDTGADTLLVAPCYGKVESSNLQSPNKRIFIIEDAAESFCGSLSGRPAGSFGHISTISFYANKIATSGEGGAVLTDDEELYRRMKTILNHGIEGKAYVSTMTGVNGRMTDLQAAILCAQLDRLPSMLERRREILRKYYVAIGHRWTFASVGRDEIEAPWLLAGIPVDRAGLIQRCEAENIEWRPFFAIPKNCGFNDGGVTQSISDRGICLPLSSALTDDEVSRICEVLRG